MFFWYKWTALVCFLSFNYHSQHSLSARVCTLEGVRQDVHYHTIGQVCVYFPNCLSLYVDFFSPIAFLLLLVWWCQIPGLCVLSDISVHPSVLGIIHWDSRCDVQCFSKHLELTKDDLPPPSTKHRPSSDLTTMVSARQHTTSTRLVVSQSENEGHDGVCRHLSIFLTLPFSFFIVFFYRSLIKANYFSRVCKPCRGDRVLPVERLQSLRVAHPFLMQFEVSVSPPEKRFLHGHWVWFLLPFKSPGLDFECQLADLLSVPWLSRLECVSVYYKAFQMFFIGLCTEWFCRR